MRCDTPVSPNAVACSILQKSIQLVPCHVLSNTNDPTPRQHSPPLLVDRHADLSSRFQKITIQALIALHQVRHLHPMVMCNLPARVTTVHDITRKPLSTAQRRWENLRS